MAVAADDEHVGLFCDEVAELVAFCFEGIVCVVVVFFFTRSGPSMGVGEIRILKVASEFLTVLKNHFFVFRPRLFLWVRF